MTEAWYYGVTIRVGIVDPLLASLRASAPAGVRVQRSGSAHLTLLYTQPRPGGACAPLAAAVRRVAAATEAFQLELGGVGEFQTPDRVVAWLGVAQTEAALDQLRTALCTCDDDVLGNRFVPHVTLLYATPPAAYTPFRPVLHRAANGLAGTIDVAELWIAGFPQRGHPADDLMHQLRIPLRDRG